MQFVVARKLAVVLQPRTQQQHSVRLLEPDGVSDGLDPLPLRMDALALEHVVDVAEETHREPTVELRVLPFTPPKHDGHCAISKGREELKGGPRR